MIHHYITKYWNEDGDHVAEAWLQINLFNWCFCLFRRKLLLNDYFNVIVEDEKTGECIATIFNRACEGDPIGVVQDGLRVYFGRSTKSYENSDQPVYELKPVKNEKRSRASAPSEGQD